MEPSKTHIEPKSYVLCLVAFCVALALLDAQVTVTRLLAYRLFYHFVFFVISLSQLGLAGAGAWVYASGRTRWSAAELSQWLLVFAAFPLVVLMIYGWTSPLPDLYFAKLDGISAAKYLFALSLGLVGLNFCGGMVLTILFTNYKKQIGQLYASDLAGAAVGCLASVALMLWGGPIRAFVFCGVVALIASLLVAREIPDGLAVNAKMLWSLTLLGLYGATLYWPQIFDPDILYPQRAQMFSRTKWNHLARTDRRGPLFYVIDGDASTNLAENGPNPPVPEYKLIPDKPKVAIIGVGAGPQLLAARKQNASSVLAIDINPTILAWAQEEDKAQGFGIFSSPPVTAIVGEGRHVLRSQKTSFDLIIMHAIDTYTASSQGAYSLTENFLYTSEAMRDYLDKLTPEGVLSIRRWLFWPPRENLRLFTTAFQALRDEGVANPKDHVLVLSPQADYRKPDQQVWGYVMVSKTPFSEARLAALDRYIENNGWTYIYRPGRTFDTPFEQFAKAESPAAFFHSYPYVVTPASDRNPFFFQFTSPWSSWTSEKGREEPHLFYGQSSRILPYCVALTVILTLVMLGAPLWRRRSDFATGGRWARSLVYFSCLGGGFMAIELPVIQVMTLFLGHPTYALCVVLFGLLLSAGLGSLLMGRMPLRVGRIALIINVVLGLASAFGLLPLVHAAIALSDPARFALTVLYLALIGIPLGMPFVAGIRALEASRPHQVAGVWAINGASAVVGSGLLMMVMVFSGSDTCLLLGALAYTIAWAVAPRGDFETLVTDEAHEAKG